MTKEETIEILKALNMMLHSPDGEPISDMCEAIDMAIEALQDDWIPCSERLPEEMEYVLVTDGIEVWEDRIEKVKRTGTYRWEQCMSPVYLCGEWHWRPLPEPYKESEE